MTDARRLYRLHLGLAVAGGGVALAALAVGVTRIRLDLPSTGELLAACRQLVPIGATPALLLALFPVALGTAAGVRGIRSLRRQLRAQARFLRSLRPTEETQVGAVDVTIVDDVRATAFCAGILRPRIYVSTAAIALLTPAELAAVLAHESHHRSRRDPLRILCARALADAFYFLPFLRRVSDRYAQLAELAADEAAAHVSGRSVLASALLRFGERGGQAAPVIGIAPERVEHLLGEPPRWQLPLAALSGSVAAAAALLGLALAAPAVIASESVSLATVIAESCMLAMVVAPVTIGFGAAWLSRSWIRRRLSWR